LLFSLLAMVLMALLQGCGKGPATGTTPASASFGVCPDELSLVFADMHDGDKKEVTISGSSMTIKPNGNTQKWVVQSKWDAALCSAIIDFNVTGKPSFPPVSLVATLFHSYNINKEVVTELEFTDPSGTLPAGPLNRWIQVAKPTPEPKQIIRCPEKLTALYADMHDGDKKEISIDGSSLVIKPSGNDEKWVVTSHLDRESCRAIVDFNVPGKPSPPDVKLVLTFKESFSVSTRKTELGFHDPSGTLAAADFPLNLWVELLQKSSSKHEHLSPE